MIIREIQSKTILSKSQVYPYVVNPYVGCQHACSYCYARFMKRFTGHKEAWGEFVDVKINAVELLEHEISRKQPQRVWVSGVCDPYQPLEAKYRLTRGCLQIFAAHGWSVAVQTRSPLVTRDLEILQQGVGFEAGLSITTADDHIRRLFEPLAPSIPQRIAALETLHAAGVRTYAMIAPMLPGAGGLAELLRGRVDFVILDRMNYHHADWVYRRYGLEWALKDDFFAETETRLKKGLAGVEVR